MQRAQGESRGDDLYARLDSKEGEAERYQLPRQRDRDRKNVQQVRVIKDRDISVLTDASSVTGTWKKYCEELIKDYFRPGSTKE